MSSKSGKIMIRLLCVSVLVVASSALDNGLARTPQMGYNSWYDLMDAITEQNIRQTADALVSTGLRDLGYKYLNLDDDWATTRDSQGRLVADPSKWTNGSLASIADYVHKRGLLFGTYTDRGTKTCGGRPGAQGNEDIDAQTYADWGVDYLKEDSCNAPGDKASAFKQYGRMRDALNKTGRPILFSLCGWNPWYAPPDPTLNYSGGASLGNSFRIGPDDTNWAGVLSNIDINAPLYPYAGPGGWNDPCLLLSSTWSGQQRITERQSRSQFSMWAIMASPLLISGDIRNMSAYNLATYKNKEVIDVSQDALGKQGWRVAGTPLSGKSSGNTNIWARPLAGGSVAAVFLNNAEIDTTITCNAACFGKMGFTAGQRLDIRDLWAQRDLRTIVVGERHDFTPDASGTAEGGCTMFKFTPSSTEVLHGTSDLTPIVI